MANEQPQTRVLLFNGQTLVLQGDVDNNDISADLLQQALQDATDTTTNEESHEEYTTAPVAAEDNNNLAVYFQDQGEAHGTQAIQLSVEQAEALGFHFQSDDGDKFSSTNLAQTATTSQLPLEDTGQQLLYAENSASQTEQKALFEPCIDNQQPVNNLQDSIALQDGNKLLEQAICNIGMLQGTNNYVGDSNNITVLPQFVNGQMTFTVRLNEQNEDFSVLQGGNNNGEEAKENKLSLLAPLSVSSLPNSTSSSLTTSMPSVCISNISTVNTLPSVTQTTGVPATTNNLPTIKTSSPNVLLDKSSKPQYAIVPKPTTNATSILAKSNIVQPQLVKAVGRNQILTPVKVSGTTTQTTIPTPSTTTLTGIPIMNSNINVTRTSPSAGLLQSVSTTLTGGGMIRVVAGGSTPRITSSNGPKFTNILTSSGRLVAATTNTTTPITTTTTTTGSMQRILSATPNTTTVKSVAVTTNSTPVSTEPQTATPTPRVNFNSTKPLGSSENPIQLVQHGQTFHSVQALSQEQLRQIATVLQQQHLDSAPRTKNVLYDAETNTRIIYRVVYPEDLDLREPSSPSDRQVPAGIAPGRGRGRRGRPPKSSARPLGRGHPTEYASTSSVGRKPGGEDIDEDRLLDDASKGERKKQVARTRSGRLSRPPRHMVKDYKRLHHLDFADADLDDSDGGYSDYQTSDREVEENDVSVSGTSSASGQVTDAVKQEAETPAATALLPGLEMPKRKISSHFRCPTCQKIYLGHSRMSRHFEMFPDHGSIEQLKTPPPPESPPLPLPDSAHTKIGMASVNGIMRSGPARRRGKRRGPWAYMTPEARSERRKIKLREALATCETTELSEVAGPAVAKTLSLWELLLMRVEAVRAEESLMATLCEELRSLLKKVQDVAGEVLQPVDHDIDTKDEKLELQDKVLCNALGLPSGHYQVVDDHLLSSYRSRLYDIPAEPPEKRCKIEDTSTDPPLTEKKPSCPEVLSALALDPKPVACLPSRLPSPSSVTKDVPKKEDPIMMDVDSKDSDPMDVQILDKPVEPEQDEHQFLLPPTSDICVDGLTPAPESSQQAAQDIQIVDDLVNERLENFTGFPVTGSEPVEQRQKTTNHQDLMDNLSQFPETHPSTVSAFDPEMALAAIGEGEQNVNNSPVSQFNTNNEFSPEISLAAMGEGEQENTRSTEETPTPFASLSSSVVETNFSLTQNANQTPTTVPETFKSSLQMPEVKSNRSPIPAPIESNNSSDAPYHNLTLHIINKSEEIKPKEEPFSPMLESTPEDSLINSLATESTTDKCDGNSVPSVTSFDPPLALGENTESGRVEMEGNTFDPEITLSNIETNATAAETSTTQFPRQTGASNSDTSFQISGMDVSLDESGSEIDFEALGVEFCRTTQHS